MGAIASDWTTHRRILVLGLDGVGKTTLLYKLELEEVETSIVTIDLYVETSTVHGEDIGSHGSARSLRKFYFQNTDAVIFVVDDADKHSIAKAANELLHLFRHEQIKNAKLMAYANEQDRLGCMPLHDVREQFNLDNVRGIHITFNRQLLCLGRHVRRS
uniref:ADP-ribosylation factor n=1 Tax=Globisporangium ultimum (strain ATCC 200006 / CBS 805.95 / DAOM BR144) TaxID=431595 RepID=K3W910_GLOUD